jgi:hypothetical protein
MAKSFYLPYKAANPRSVRGAKKRGWHVIVPKPSYVEKTSWLGLNMWCGTRCSGYWIGNFAMRKFAFEKSSDAMLFQLTWG